MKITLLEQLGITGAVVLLALVLALLGGWVMNFYAFIVGVAHFVPTDNWVLLVARAMGIFVFPVGGILGFF